MTASEYFEFPRTPHLHGSGHIGSDDRTLSEAATAEFLGQPLIVQEKMDGSLIGLSVGSGGNLVAQSRSGILGEGRDHEMYSYLVHHWLPHHRDALRDALKNHFVLFGELLIARHNKKYSLPDAVLFFDILDSGSGLFLSHERIREVLSGTSMETVPLLADGLVVTSVQDLVGELHGQSKFSSVDAEGLYIRAESGGVVTNRAKWVAPGFLPGHPRWSRSRIVEKNVIVGRRQTENP